MHGKYNIYCMYVLYSRWWPGFLIYMLVDGCDVQVNNAAMSKLRRANEYEAEEFSRIMETNLESPYHLAQLTYPLLKATGNASIVFISSLAGHIALPAISVYASSKGMVVPIYIHMQLMLQLILYILMI